jgi:hypothetical protein
LIEQVAPALGALGITGPFGLGAAEPRAIRIGLFRRLRALATLLESL